MLESNKKREYFFRLAKKIKFPYPLKQFLFQLPNAFGKKRQKRGDRLKKKPQLAINLTLNNVAKNKWQQRRAVGPPRLKEVNGKFNRFKAKKLNQIREIVDTINYIWYLLLSN